MLEVRRFSPNDQRYRHILARNDNDDQALFANAAQDIHMVRERGLDGLIELIRAREWSDADPDRLAISEDEMAEARNSVSESFLTAISLARVNLRKFHEYQRRRGYLHDDGDGVRLSKRVAPLGRVGLVCGDSFSNLLMCAVPAQVAGVDDIVAAVPPGPDGSVSAHYLAAAKVLGIQELYRMGKTHAAAALALGVVGKRRVDKLVGPGGPEVCAAKQLLAGKVGVDLSAGAAELAVLADKEANARFVAADMLAQAERRSGVGTAVLFSTSRLLAEAVRIELGRMLDALPNRDRIAGTLANDCGLYVCQSVGEAVAAINAMAPANLILSTTDNEVVLADIENAGAVYLGPWSGEIIGDALTGINQLVPTAGAVRFASGLGVDDFVREMTIVDYTPTRLAKTGRHMTLLAEAEGGVASADAVRERLEVLRLAQ